MKGKDTYIDHPKQGGSAQTSPKHQAKMRRPLARLRVIFLEYCMGLTMAKYLSNQKIKIDRMMMKNESNVWRLWSTTQWNFNVLSKINGVLFIAQLLTT